MKNLIEYMVLFIVILLFSPNNYFTMMYVILSFIFSLGYFLCILKSKGYKGDSKQIDINIILVAIMIITVSLIAKTDYSNLIFGYGCLLIFIINGIVFFLKKEDIKKELFKKSYLFDMYSIIYLASIIEKFYNILE